jgi:hypothetical protein
MAHGHCGSLAPILATAFGSVKAGMTKDWHGPLVMITPFLHCSGHFLDSGPVPDLTRTGGMNYNLSIRRVNQDNLQGERRRKVSKYC